MTFYGLYTLLKYANKLDLLDITQKYYFQYIVYIPIISTSSRSNWVNQFYAITLHVDNVFHIIL